MSKMLKFLLSILVIIIAVVGYVYVRDQVKIKEIRTESKWISNFFISHSRYPHLSEFDAQFPSSGMTGQYAPNCLPENLYPNETSNPQDFCLDYKLTIPFQQLYAIGRAKIGSLGFEGVYEIEGHDPLHGLY